MGTNSEDGCPITKEVAQLIISHLHGNKAKIRQLNELLHVDLELIAKGDLPTLSDPPLHPLPRVGMAAYDHGSSRNWSFLTILRKLRGRRSRKRS